MNQPEAASVSPSAADQFVHEYLLLERDADGAHLHCAVCRARLCAASENYRVNTSVVDVPVEELGQLFSGMGHTIDEKIVFRGYHCPDCGHRIDAEICPESADAIWDLQLNLGSETTR
jgi:acetone carboxylase gamma subunit